MNARQTVALLLLAFSGGTVASGRQTTPDRPAWATRDLRAGIIGTDTSHVPQFTKAFASRPEWRIKVVAAYKGGSPDLSISANRLEGFARTISQEHGVELVDSVDALLAKVDVVLLESVDGRVHRRSSRSTTSTLARSASMLSTSSDPVLCEMVRAKPSSRSA